MEDLQFSIVIPLYNKEKYIDRAIQSIINQTITSWELIIVDDGSTDTSIKHVSKYTDQRIHLYKQKNQGPAVARNTGITHSKGQLVAFLDADDVWEDNFLETILELHYKFPDAGLYGTAYAMYDDNNNYLRSNQVKPELGNRILPSFFEETVSCGHTISNTSSSAVPRDILVKVGMFRPDYRCGQELDLFGRIALYFPVAYSPTVCTRYTASAGNNMDKAKYMRYVPTTRYLDSLSKEEQMKLLEIDGFKEYLDFYYLKIGMQNIYTGLRKEGREQLKMVNDSKYNLKKRLFTLVSYIPLPLSLVPSSFVRTVVNKLKMVG